MARQPMLSNPGMQAALLGQVKAGRTREDAARQLGLSGRTVTRYVDRDPSFSRALEEARADGKAMRHLQHLVHPGPRREPAGGWRGGLSRAERQARRMAEIEDRLTALKTLACGGRP